MNTSNIDDLFPCISCGVNADPADGFGKCTCGNEAKREAIQQELLKARIDELNRYDTDEDMYKTLRTVYLQAKLMDTTRESE